MRCLHGAICGAGHTPPPIALTHALTVTPTSRDFLGIALTSAGKSLFATLSGAKTRSLELPAKTSLGGKRLARDKYPFARPIASSHGNSSGNTFFRFPQFSRFPSPFPFLPTSTRPFYVLRRGRLAHFGKTLHFRHLGRACAAFAQRQFDIACYFSGDTPFWNPRPSLGNVRDIL